MVLKFLQLFKSKKEKQLDHLSQEHLDKLLNRQAYLKQLLAATGKKINHANWSVRVDFGIQNAILARTQLHEEMVRITMEIDFLTGFLKD